MDAQVIASPEQGKDCARNSSNAELKGRPVGKNPDDVFRDLPVGRGRLEYRKFLEFLIRFDKGVHVIDVDERVTEDSWHSLVHLDDDPIGHLDRREGSEDLDAEGEQTMPIGRCGHQERRIDPGPTTPHQFGDLRKMAGNVVGATRPDLLSIRRSDEPGEMANESLLRRLGEGVLSEEQDVRDLDSPN
jgi:hypothetical protein